MLTVSSLLPLAVFFDAQLVRWMVWVGLVVLTMALLLLIRTRWGQSQPLGKCIVLSLLAHLLLGIYMTTVTIVTATVGSPDGKGLQVALVDGGAPASSAAGTSLDGVSGEGPGEIFDAEASSSAPLAPASELPANAAPQRDLSTEPVREYVPSKPAIAAPTEEVPPALAGIPRAATAPRKTTRQAEPVDLADPTAVPAGEIDTAVPPPEPADAPDASSNDKQNPQGSPQPVNAADGESPPANLGGPSTPAGGLQTVPKPYELRVGDHAEAARGQGAKPESEDAVKLALAWLAANQSATGRWDARRLGGGAGLAEDKENRQAAGAQADTGITGLCLLAFLASGHTHMQGPYQKTVRRGLEYLLNDQDATGAVVGNANVYERMYCHAMATCALSEALAMTGDKRLHSAVRRAINYTLDAQDRASGGWRYNRGEKGDTSQLGWQVMALKSAELGGIAMPQATREGIQRFLSLVTLGPNRGLACYHPDRLITSRTMTAEALACRQFLGISDTPAARAEASNYLLEETPTSGRTNVYYWYYATLALHEAQGEPWRRWNDALQKALLASQRREGALAGSWDPDPVWGGCGGRAYSTAMSTLCLEVYYRFLPLHIEAASRGQRPK